MIKNNRKSPSFFILLALTFYSIANAAGPDRVGYRSVSSTETNGPVFNFVDITTTGTRVSFFDADTLPVTNLNADDGVAIDISLGGLNGGLGFPFYGKFRDEINMSSNGFLHFIVDGSSDSLSNSCPLNATVADAIFVLWDDLVSRNPSSTIAGGYVQTFSECPDLQGGTGACVIFQWDNNDHFGGGIDSFDIEAILYENGNVLMHFGALNPEQGSGSTTGIIGETGGNSLLSLTHKCNTNNSIPDNSSILFIAPTLGFESEPNNILSEATPYTSSVCNLGYLSAIGDLDSWFIPSVNVGDELFALVDGSLSGTGSDTFLEVLNNDQSSFLAFDNNSGTDFGAAVSRVKVTEGGNLYLRVSEFTSSSVITPYLLSSLIIDPNNDFFNEVEPNELSSNATVIINKKAVGEVFQSDVDYYSLNVVEATDSISVIVNNDPDRDGLITNTLVQVIAPDGSTFIGNSEPTTGTTTAISRVFVNSSGTYFIKVRNDGGPTDTEYEMVTMLGCRSACLDSDMDLICDIVDNCSGLSNTNQLDQDSDNVGDTCDQCAGDKNKITPNICGCGIAESDRNSNGIIDCLKSDELKFRVDKAKKLLKRLSKPRNEMQLIIQTKRGNKLKLLLNNINKFTKTNKGSITTLGSVNITKLARRARTNVVSAIGFGDNFVKNKIKATKSLNALLAVI